MPELKNIRHERFCLEVVKDPEGCAGRAYERSGYKARGAAADSNASRLLKNAKVKARIAELQAAAAERTEITIDRVREEMALIGFSSVAHYTVDDEGNIALTEDAPEGAIRAISSIKRKIRTFRRGEEDVREVDIDIKLWSKDKQLELLGKHLGMYIDRVDHTSGGEPITQLRIIAPDGDTD